MAIGLHAHHFRYPEFLRLHQQGLLTFYILALVIVVIAIFVAGVGLIEQTRSFIPLE